MNDLIQPILDNRKAILLTELAALLHDLDKVRRDFISDHTGGPEQRSDILKNKISGQLDSYLRSIQVKFNGILTRPDCLEGEAGFKTDDNNLAAAFVYHHQGDNNPMPLLGHILNGGACGADGIDSGLDKMKEGVNAETVQKWLKDIGISEKGVCQNDERYIATPFGYEHGANKCENDYAADIEKILKYAQSWAEDPSEKRREALKQFKAIMSRYLGETRRPYNDVTLWAHSCSTASLAKAVTAKMLIESEQGDFSEDNKYMLPRRNSVGDVNATAFASMLITLDSDALFLRGLKAGDTIGIVHQIKEILDALQRYIEVELPVGNVAYRDEYRMLVVLPYLSSWPGVFERGGARDLHAAFEDELRGRLHRQVENLLIKYNCHELPYDISFESGFQPSPETRKKPIPKENYFPHSKALTESILKQSANLLAEPRACRLSPNALRELDGTQKNPNSLVCNVCGVRSYKEDENICSACKDRRTGRAGKWAKDALAAKEGDGKTTTIWLPEVAAPGDNRLALFSLSFDLARVHDGSLFKAFGLKVDNENELRVHPSPGRLRRCWEACQSFFDDVNEEMKSSLNAKRLALQFDDSSPPGNVDQISVKIGGHDAFECHRHGDYWLSISRLKNREAEEIDRQQRQGDHMAAKIRSNGNGSREVKEKPIVSSAEALPYHPAFEITSSPVRCEFVITASAAGDMIRRINDLYHRQLAKVQTRLPLSMGVVFFHQKFPLYAAIEASRRMQRLLKPTEEKLKVIKNGADNTSENGVHFRLETDVAEGHCPAPPAMQMPLTCGDGTPDPFHTRVKLAGDGEFRYAGEMGKLERIRQGDELETFSGRFDFLLLDTAGRLGDIHPGEVRHPVLGSRPAYPFRVLEQFMTIGKRLQELHSHQIKNIEGALCEKRHLWRDLGDYTQDNVVDNFCRGLLFDKNAFKPYKAETDDGRLLLAAAKNGLLIDAIDFYTRLTKGDINKGGQS